ncbi:MAG: heavy-metal-associated domain-containing protein, partial [Rubrivivax sp.]|nr:heavy-metal-associated domain-containing protein [Rubrivivax sp.]
MIDVRDMLSVLSVQGIEERIGEIPGVESVTVNHAAATATVRYDETRLHVGDIKSDVRQRGYAASNEPTPKHGAESEPAAQAPPPQSPARLPEKHAENAAPTTPETDAAPATPAATPSKDAGSGALPKPTAAAAALVGEVASLEAPLPAGTDGEAPGPLKKVTTWVREALTGDDKDKVNDKDKSAAHSSSSEAEPPRTSTPPPAAGAPA